MVQQSVEHELAQLRAIFATMPDFVVAVDRGGRILFINRVQEGREMADILGTDAREYIHPDYHATFDAALEATWSTGEPGTFDIVVHGLEGVDEHYRTRIFPLRQDGRIVAAVEIATDVTELKAAERDLELMRRILPLCAWCRKIRGKDEEWQSIEAYLRESSVDVTHGLCPNCAAELLEELPSDGISP